MSTTDRFRQPQHRIVMAILLAMFTLVVVGAVAAQAMEREGPILVIHGPLFAPDPPEPCVESIHELNPSGVLGQIERECKGDAEGRVENIEEGLWWVCECPDRNRSFDAVPGE